MISPRYFIRLLSAFLARFRALLFIGVIFGIIVFLLLRFVSPLVFGKTTERIGITGRYRTNNLPEFILDMVGDGLTSTNEAGVVEPNLATSWETPDKGKTWIFYLKEGVLWQDGKKVTSETINYEFSDVVVERPDEATLVFKLKDPFSPFPSVVSRPVFKRGLLGTGEWKVTKATLAGGFVQKLIVTDRQKNKKIYKFYPTEERTKTAYKLGEVDTLVNILNPTPFDTWKTAKVEEDVDRGRVALIFFNVQDKLLSEKSLRQALTYAVNKKEFRGGRALSPISPDSWVYNPQVKEYSYDPERAQDLIDDLADELKEDLKVKLITTPVLLPVAEKMASDWKKVGVTPIVQVYSGIPTDYQAFLAIFEIPADPDQYAIWHSTQTTNISKYQNPRIDKLLEDGRIELDFENRRKIYLDFQRFLVEDSPAAFLYHPVSYTITRK